MSAKTLLTPIIEALDKETPALVVEGYQAISRVMAERTDIIAVLEHGFTEGDDFFKVWMYITRTGHERRGKIGCSIRKDRGEQIVS